MRKFLVFSFLILLFFSLCFTCSAAPFEIVLPDYQMIPLMELPLGSYSYTFSFYNGSVSGVSTLYFGNLSIDNNPPLPSYYMPLNIYGTPFVFVGQLHENYMELLMTIDGQSVPYVDGEKIYLSFEQIINPPLEDSIKDGLSNVISYVQSVIVYIGRSPLFIIFIIGLCVSLLFLAIKFIKVF